MTIADAISELLEIQRILRSHGDAHGLEPRLDVISTFLNGTPAIGLTHVEYHKFREYLETKVRGLANLAADAALKYVDTDQLIHKHCAKTHQIEENALREALRELHERRQMTLKDMI